MTRKEMIDAINKESLKQLKGRKNVDEKERLKIILKVLEKVGCLA